MSHVIHIVWLKYKEGVDEKMKQEIFAESLKLKETCVLKEAFEGLVATNAPYILDFKAGRQASTQIVAADVDDVFVLTFPTAKHRDYYLTKDEVHSRFVKEYIIGKVNPLVADFASVI